MLCANAGRLAKTGLLPNRINEVESHKIEILAIEININKRKWIIPNV